MEEACKEMAGARKEIEDARRTKKGGTQLTQHQRNEGWLMLFHNARSQLLTHFSPQRRAAQPTQGVPVLLPHALQRAVYVSRSSPSHGVAGERRPARRSQRRQVQPAEVRLFLDPRRRMVLRPRYKGEWCRRGQDCFWRHDFPDDNDAKFIHARSENGRSPAMDLMTRKAARQNVAGPQATTLWPGLTQLLIDTDNLTLQEKMPAAFTAWKKSLNRPCDQPGIFEALDHTQSIVSNGLQLKTLVRSSLYDQSRRRVVDKAKLIADGCQGRRFPGHDSRIARTRLKVSSSMYVEASRTFLDSRAKIPCCFSSCQNTKRIRHNSFLKNFPTCLTSLCCVMF